MDKYKQTETYNNKYQPILPQGTNDTTKGMGLLRQK